MSAEPPLTWRSYSITLAPRVLAEASIAIDEPRSSETRITTFAPFARHWSACVFCFCGLPSAFVITYDTPAFVNAATSAGRSCVSQRTDDFGSGSRTQMSPPPAFLLGFATAAETVTLTVRAAITSVMTSFLTFASLHLRSDIEIERAQIPGCRSPRWKLNRAPETVKSRHLGADRFAPYHGRDERARDDRRREADAADPGNDVPGPAADVARPTAAPGRGDHLAAGARPGGVRVPALDRADPRLAADVRRARGRDRLPPPARDHVAGERAPDRQRRRLHPPRGWDGARRLVEHARLVDLRRDGRRLPALEAPDPVPRPPHLQPVEPRARPLFPAPRPRARRPARVLVGADVGVARACPPDHRRRGLRDPAAAPPARDRLDVLGHVRHLDRGAGRQRARHDGALASRPGLRLVLLARPRLLAGDPRLPVLHDHRPEDDPRRAERAPDLRCLDRAPCSASDRAADNGVRGESGRALLARARLPGPAAAGAGERRARRPGERPLRRRRRTRRRRRLRRAARRGRDPRPVECRGDDPPVHRSASGRDRRARGGHCAGRPADGGADRP